MNWLLDLVLEDVTGLLVQLFFAITIILMIRDKQKPPLMTSIPTGIALIIFGLGGSISAPLVAGLSVFAGALWLVLAWQRHMQNNIKHGDTPN